MTESFKERHVRERNPEEVIISLREVADQALAILEPGDNVAVGIGAINEALGLLEAARHGFVGRGLTDYAKDCADLIQKLNDVLVQHDPNAKQNVIEELHKLADDE